MYKKKFFFLHERKSKTDDIEINKAFVIGRLKQIVGGGDGGLAKPHVSAHRLLPAGEGGNEISGLCSPPSPQELSSPSVLGFHLGSELSFIKSLLSAGRGVWVSSFF